MRRTAVLAILVLIAATMLCAAEKAPKLSIEKSTADFGEVIRGEVVEADFIIRNTGTENLVISDARPSCGCTIASFDKIIEPGKEGKVHAKLDTKDYSGPNSWTITIESNDAEIPYMKLYLRANVKTIVSVIPKSSIRFTKLEREPITKTVTVVTEQAGNDFTISDPKPDQDYIKVKIRQLPDSERDPTYPNKQYEVQVDVGPEAPVGTVNATVTMKTNEPKVPTITLRLLGLVRPAVMVSPPVLTSGPTPAGKDFHRSVLVIDSGDTPSLKVKSVTSDLPFLSFEIEEMAPNKQYRIHVKMLDDAPSGPFNGTMTIECDYPDAHYRTMTVPVRGEVKG
ncbi:MAG TPA: DUF1573 domain-containing protein [Thermoanaerobaculia bacterium]|nr:DUF1573 domain-containing protein [Thermoanaerobaculia bacterium]HUM30515.1 DUF1573 domain-containing protein [Thermoanaerobaculia bacterium]HXK68707.1 DUF1573 domain-containing protein [Thermoanaerobaculia bacterium]